MQTKKQEKGNEPLPLVEKKCVACGAPVRAKQRPEAKTALERNQVDFVCRSCGARNLRSGTAQLKKDAIRENKVKPSEEKEVKPREQSHEENRNQEESKDSPFFF